MARPAVTVTGIENVLRELNRRTSAIQNATNQSLQDVAFEIMSKAQELAPLDTGDLRGSGYAEVKNMNIELGFKAPYALVQHERMDFKHPKGGQAKYLERPLKMYMDKYVSYIKRNAGTAVENPGLFSKVVNKLKGLFGSGNRPNPPTFSQNLNNFNR